MGRIKSWFTDEAKLRIIRIVISAAALIVSLGGWMPGDIDIAWVAIILCGIPIIVGALKAVIEQHDITADVLVSVALLASLLTKDYFAAGEVALIMEIGSALEDWSASRAKKGIKSLIGLMPTKVRVRHGDKEEMVPVEDVKVGDTIVILAGETIPTDGVITSGTAAVDQSVMTGESLPVDKAVGDKVLSGTVNKTGVFEYSASTVVADSSLQKMIDLAKKAEEDKAPIVTLADKWASWLVIATFAASLLTFLINWGVLNDYSVAFERAAAVLVVVCPCAFILATPTAISAGIGNASRHGLLVKSGDALERFGAIDMVAFDKTGTLTYGKLGVKEVRPLSSGFTEKDVLDLAAVAEARSEHPIGEAIRAASDTKDQASSYKVFPGKGISASYEGKNLLVGKADFLKENGIHIDESVIDEHKDAGATIVYLAVGGKAAGLIALSDTLRDAAIETVAKLKEMNVKSVLLTGDGKAAANMIAERLNVSEVRSGLLPEDKERIIREYQKEGHKVCMIGDGINDAVALTAADAAIAMGGIGSDIAIESSDVVLVQDDISKVPYLIYLSRRVRKKILVNIIISITLNSVATVLAAIGILDSVIGAIVHNTGSVFVVLNSLLLLLVRDRTDRERKKAKAEPSK
jgi:heavy metal translocating P-type ATPase